ncbi:MAG: pirin family protein [Alphaproteobacteria bacterium]
MVTIYPYSALGHANHGWLDARHHFSFAGYRNPQRLGFGRLLVINDDTIAAGRGFASHPHDNMEIITYVRAGAITHQDSLGNKGRTAAGDVQVMSAGTGVRHSEFNHETIATTLYQIWIEPNRVNVEPRWEAREFPKEVISHGGLPILVSGQEQHVGQGALFIYQDAAIYGGKLVAGASINQVIKHQAYILASLGSITINGNTLQQGDGAEITDTKNVTIKAEGDAEILLIDVPQ